MSNNQHSSGNKTTDSSELHGELVPTHELSTAESLRDALKHILSQQGYPIDNIRLQDVIRKHDNQRAIDQGRGINTLGGVVGVLAGLGIEEAPEILEQPDAAFLPLLAYHARYGWGVIDGQTPQGLWKLRQDQQTRAIGLDEIKIILRLRLQDDHVKKRNASFTDLLKTDLFRYKGVVVEAVIASFLINFLALAVSLFSLQVYDRVIPTRAVSTLVILASGVALFIIFEAFMKFARSKIMDKVVVGLDQYLSREVFQRLLRVRIDQMPGSVGSMAAQLRGYEQVRSFFTASTLFGLVDLPMTIIFLSLIAYIGSPLVALVPIVASLIAITMGLFARKRIDAIAAEGAAASYYKTGLLVETVEGVETIKAGAGSWKFLSRWLDVMNITIKNDLDMKHANDYLSYFTQMLQQTSYVGIVITGAFVVMSGEMTMGGLIACSILGGRVLAPVMAIPNLLVQYSHAKAAKGMIESIFALEQDNHGVNYPLSPTKIRGHYQCDDLVFNYMDNDRPAVSIKKLVIQPGERIAILGPIGSGKSTLLKLLSGLYAPTSGRILLDGLDIQQISREALSEQVGYLQQDHRLFQGTLRENLLIGMPAPDDDVLHDALQKTGLINLVANHSSGLDLPISEGGRGLSGGQKQLVAFTRLLLTKPSVLLIDEPTASMDNRQEQRCLQVLRDELKDGQTLVVSTHKTALLELVDRIIIMDNHQIVMDGAKEAVLKQLMQNEQAKRQGGVEQLTQQAKPALKAAPQEPKGPQDPNTPKPNSPKSGGPATPTGSQPQQSKDQQPSRNKPQIVIKPASEASGTQQGSNIKNQGQVADAQANKHQGDSLENNAGHTADQSTAQTTGKAKPNTIIINPISEEK
ncbi:type I secretion system permease/ATPase [Psychrobacter lutiphocae]|uniref:type I secretion system permease/ATPase n=1 Tax=Psychrobacter lutiphocae TaxID=540500 RepID=UPI0003739370|nr:type I secretion system permease/ATPase [Psychrobacter lutiphocae]